LELKWENITISTKPTTRRCSKIIDPIRTLLSDVSGSVKTGEVLAIIGPSGAGKTTLLNFLSKKIETKNLKCTGKIRLNGIEVLNDDSNTDSKNNFKSSDLVALSSYVMQDDILEATLTPKEILLFTAKLKLKDNDQEIEKKVHLMIKELNLQNCKDTPIGDNMVRGVSGGERKRASIGVELISDPKIVFLDEPTTGLDSYNAYEVVDNLRLLAEIEQKIIIFTIHQPSSEIFSLLNKIFIIADGKTVFFGDKENSIDFFNNNLKLAYPKNYNPFEYFIEMINYEILKNKKVKAISVYGNILNNLEGKDDKQCQNAYSAYIKILSEIFAGKKKLILNSNKKNPSDYIDYELVDDNSIPNNLIQIEKFDDENKTVQVNLLKNNLLQTNDFIPKEELDKIIQEKSVTKGFFYEFKMLCQRNTVCSSRNANVLLFSVMNNIVVAIFAAILFNNVKFFIFI